MSTHIWLRAEEKPLEERTALTPKVARKLLQAGFRVTVEKSTQSAISPAAFALVGCDLAEIGSWKSAPEDTIILGLKELQESDDALIHRHIHFAHVYKEQTGWKGMLSRFVQGGGSLYDIEYLTTDIGRRVAAFGYWAGFVGAAVAMQAWIGRQRCSDPILGALAARKNKDALIKEIQPELESIRHSPKVLVIGALGRSGQGALELMNAVGIEPVEWDIAETKVGGPFSQILDFDILVNCVFVQSAIPPFLTPETLSRVGRHLSVICDVSCDPYGEYNPLPIYNQCTSFDKPVLRIIAGENPLDLISIDHLPSMLPLESSEDFCDQLTPHLLQLNDLSQGVWARAYAVFQEKTALL